MGVVAVVADARAVTVPVIAVTGSLAVGQRIASLAAPMMKKLHLELGGKDPMVIAPDVDIEVAVKGLAYAALINTGQVCTSTERVYIHESIFPQVSEELADLCGVSQLLLEEGPERGMVVLDLRSEPRCERSWKRDGTVQLRSDGGLLSDRDAEVLGV